MKWYFCIAASVLSLIGAPTVYAASDITFKFDGAYDVATELVPWMSTGASCGSLAVESVQIRKGFVRGAAHNAPATVRGFITAEGYLEAILVPAEGRAVPLNGRLDEGLLSAGAIDQASGCVWIVKLTPRPVTGTNP